MKRFPSAFALMCLLCVPTFAADKESAKKLEVKPAAKKAPAKPSGPPPTMANVSYGDDPRQVIDFYQAKSDKPTPVVFYIHGGGWMGGSKENVGAVPTYHAAGISVVSVEYRFVSQAQAAGIQPPVKWPLSDAARALQFVRSKAKEWNLDKTRIAATGGSAGAASSLWLAFHDEMADPKSDDPIARESTRLICAAVSGPQTCFDPKLMKEWMPNSKYGGHAYGFVAGEGKKSTFEQFLENRDKVMPWILEYSPYHLVTKDDPPVALYFNNAPAMGQDTKDPTHSANFGVGLKEKCDEVGVTCELIYPDAPNVKHALSHEYLIEKLNAGR